MKFATRILALSPSTGLLTEWAGDTLDLPVKTIEEAQDWCNKHKGYLMVAGELVEEIPVTEEDWKNIYKNTENFERTKD